MNNSDYRRTIFNTIRPPSTLSSGIGLSKKALLIYAVAMFIIGGFFFISFPLETIIVAIFAASIFSMGRE